jgi:hypothetical protein
MAWDLLKLNKGDICLFQKKNRICQERIRSGQRLRGVILTEGGKREQTGYNLRLGRWDDSIQSFLQGLLP